MVFSPSVGFQCDSLPQFIFLDILISIGEYDPQYADVANTDPISTFPLNSPTRWTILVDSLIVGQNQISVTTSVASAPGNQAVALLDSGTSYTFVLITYPFVSSSTHYARQICSY